MSIGETIKKYLKENFIAHGILVKPLKISNANLSRMLSGKRKITAEEMEVICSTLKVDIDYFYKKRTEQIKK